MRINEYSYKHKDGSTSTINTKTKQCDCYTFLDKAKCKHLTAACMNDNIQLRGMLTIPKFLKTLSKRWRKRNSAKDDSYVADDPPVTEVQMPATQPLTATQAINSRGMVRIAGKTYSKNGKLIGRRPMSRNDFFMNDYNIFYVKVLQN